jgi:hypothetical protein
MQIIISSFVSGVASLQSFEYIIRGQNLMVVFGGLAAILNIVAVILNGSKILKLLPTSVA